jgi:hypothetical protein
MPAGKLYTSIPGELKRTAQREDYGETYQRECVDSWRKAGLEVVSINPDSELELLERKGLGVEIVSNGTADRRTSIGSIVSAILASGDQIAGIMNADCFLVNPGYALDAVLSASADSLVLLERLNIDSESLCPTGYYSGGFDGFFFDTRFLPDIGVADPWTIGSPQWDYWFPLVMHIAGAKLKKPEALILLHLNHETKWSKEEYLDNASKLSEGLRILNLDGLPACVRREIRAYQDGSDTGECATERFLNAIASWIIESREPFPLCQPGAPGDILRRILLGFQARTTFP